MQEYLEYIVNQCGDSEFETRLAELYITQLDTPEHSEGMTRLMRSFKEKSFKKKDLKMSFEVYMESQDLLYPSWVKSKLVLLGYLRSMKSLDLDRLSKMMEDGPQWTMELSVLRHKVILLSVTVSEHLMLTFLVQSKNYDLVVTLLTGLNDFAGAELYIMSLPAYHKSQLLQTLFNLLLDRNEKDE